MAYTIDSYLVIHKMADKSYHKLITPYIASRSGALSCAYNVTSPPDQFLILFPSPLVPRADVEGEDCGSAGRIQHTMAEHDRSTESNPAAWFWPTRASRPRVPLSMQSEEPSR